MFYSLHPAAYCAVPEPDHASIHLGHHKAVHFEQWTIADSALIAALRVPMTMRLAQHLHRSYGGNGSRAHRVLTVLHEAGLVHQDTTAHTLWQQPHLAAECAAVEGLARNGTATAQRRALTTVGVSGLTPTAVLVCHILAQSGVGKVVVDDPQRVTDLDVSRLAFSMHDVGLRKDRALAAGGFGSSTQVLVGRPVEVGCDVVLVGGTGSLAPERTSAVMRHRVPHLPVTAWQLEAWVGPFVLPYQSSCYHCAQLHGATSGPSWHHDPALRSANANGHFARTAALAAAVAANQLLAWIDQRVPPSSLNATVHCAADTAQSCVLPVPASVLCPCHGEFLDQDASLNGQLHVGQAR